MNNILKQNTFNEETGELKFTVYTKHKKNIVEAIRIDIDDSNFLKIKETLERIGIYSGKTKTLWQSVHILHKKGFYYIVHFKQMFALDGREDVEMTEEDFDRLHLICGLLEKFGLVKKFFNDQTKIKKIMEKEIQPKIRIIKFDDRRNFNLKPKYTIGGKN